MVRPRVCEGTHAHREGVLIDMDGHGRPCDEIGGFRHLEWSSSCISIYGKIGSSLAEASANITKSDSEEHQMGNA